MNVFYVYGVLWNDHSLNKAVYNMALTSLYALCHRFIWTKQDKTCLFSQSAHVDSELY